MPAYRFENREVPERMVEKLQAYAHRGELPGGFLQAVLTNDLVEAFGRADPHNAYNMHAYAGYLDNVMPSEAWGSREKVAAWCDAGGQQGLDAAAYRETERAVLRTERRG